VPVAIKFPDRAGSGMRLSISVGSRVHQFGQNEEEKSKTDVLFSFKDY